MAKLYFNYSAMSAGKTIDVITTAYKYNSKGMKALVMKPSIDTKGAKSVVSRIGLEREVDILLKPEESLFDYIKKYGEITCLIVDEAQFLTEKQVCELFVIAKKLDIPVICFGLKGDFQSNLFQGSEALFRFADTVEEMVSICSCGKKARFNARKVNGEYVFEGKQVEIGADDSYDPLCGKCYLEKVLLPHSEDFQKIYKKVRGLN